MNSPELVQRQLFDSGSAMISPCGRYRYSLRRVWSEGPRVCFIMLNPSTADAEVNDPTIRRCIGFARSWGFGSLEVGNLFAYRATDPRELLEAPDPVGPMNEAALRMMALYSAARVVAWGANPLARRRWREVLDDLGGIPTWQCLGTTKDGSPRHPLYVPRGQPLVAFDGSRP